MTCDRFIFKQMDKLYLIHYQILSLQEYFDFDLELQKSDWKREEFTAPVWAEDVDNAVRKLKTHLSTKKEIGKKEGRKLNIISVVKEIR